MTAPVGKKSAETFQQELEALFRENYQRIYRAAYSVTGNRGDAEDVLQTVFLSLIQGQPSRDLGKNPQAYLFRSAINAGVSAVRARERRKLTGAAVESLEIPAPESDSDRDDEIARMRTAMAKMKPGLVETLNLRYKEECSCLEIARIRGKPLGTVLADLYRARAELKRLTRIQEKHRETQQKKHGTDRSPLLADASGT